MKTKLKYLSLAGMLIAGTLSNLSASQLCDAEENGKPGHKYREYYTSFLRPHDGEAYLGTPVAEQPAFLLKDLSNSMKLTTDLEAAASEINCPMHKGFLYFMAGGSTKASSFLYKKFVSVAGELKSFEKAKPSTLHENAKSYYEEAVKEFEKQVNPLDSDEFQKIYRGNHGPQLFIYGRAIKHLEELTAEEDVTSRITYLNKLFNLVTELSKNKKMYLNAPSFRGMRDGYINNIFSELGYANRSEAHRSYIPIDKMFLDNPRLMLSTIDWKRRNLMDPTLSFETVLEEWKIDLFSSTP